MGDEGEARDGRLWARLPVPAPCKCFHVYTHTQENINSRGGCVIGLVLFTFTLY